MNHPLRRLLAAAAWCVLSGAAMAQTPFYITGSGGALLRQPRDFSTTFFNGYGATAPGSNSYHFDPGPAVNLGLGMALPFGLRVEGELGYDHYTIAREAPFAQGTAFPALNGTRLNLGSGGERQLFTATINGFYDMPLPGAVVPYIGAGAGFYHSIAEASHFTTAFGSGFNSPAGTGDNALILAELGLTVHLAPRLSVVPAYRYEHLFTSSGPGGDASVVKLGFRYAF